MDRKVVQTIAFLIEEQFPHRAESAGLLPSLTVGANGIAAQLNIRFTELGLKGMSREMRIAFLEWLFETPLTSTKDLTIAQAEALLKCLPYLKDLWNQYVSSMTITGNTGAYKGVFRGPF